MPLFPVCPIAIVGKKCYGNKAGGDKMQTDPRYARNLGAIIPQEQEKLKKSRVCVIGCGGLGGYLAEFLGRMGVGHITAVDPDLFEATNLNRQLLSREDNLGKSKSEAVKERMVQVNPSVQVMAVKAYLTADNAAQLIAGHDLVLDGLDNIPTRLILQRVCREQNIPLIHGAVEGWFGQVSTVLPGDDTLSRLYPGFEESGSLGSRGPSVLSFAAGMVASVQTAEAAKLLLGKELSCRDQVLFIDLLSNSFDLLPM